MTIRDLFIYAEENGLADKEIIVVHPQAWDMLGCGTQHFVRINKEPIYIETVETKEDTNAEANT